MAIITDESMRYPIPHEPGQWVMLKQLNGAQMDVADQAQTAKVMERLGPILKALGPDANQQSQAQAEAQDPDDIKVRRAGYDPETLIQYALDDWSYEQPMIPENIARLDAFTRDWLWDTIVEANTRPPASAPGGELSSS